ncbi:hypothetical protein K503DRAFT_775966 [Rhizopogon vinicolor AM-OR11-026]|uniref:Uncharacterized protein n=1 Tax=Rhizopogon vinicolor AM-OR11-026 TaxID=1314800 RepID=A0A1B7MKJ3_9AGAM|nr:hypothetical protein K503DRAFT_775966 [Rhizopogon vinicolor AM-OR11-026]
MVKDISGHLLILLFSRLSSPGVQVIHLSSVAYISVTAMIFRISFSDVFNFIRKGPLIPEGFVLETPPEYKPTPLQRQPESPISHSTLPTISQSPVSPLAYPISETPSGHVILIGHDSTETLVNVVVQPVHPKPILILDAFAHERRQTRRISFVDSAIMSRSTTPTDAISVGQPSVATGETFGQAEDLRDVSEVEKKSRRKSIVRSMSLRLTPHAYRRKARRSSVPALPFIDGSPE